MGEYNQRLVWDKIADQWYEFRHYPLPEVKDFSFFVARQPIELNRKNKSLKKNILDVGAGCGRNLLPFKDHNLFAIDFSKEMIKQTKRYSKKFSLDIKAIKASATDIPFDDNKFDAIICIALLPCLKKGDREKCLEEMKRVLKPNGYMLISVWNRWQMRFFPNNILFSNIYVPWHRRTEILKRHYHLFTEGELKKLIEKNGLKIIKIFRDKNYKGFKAFSPNIFAVIQKPK